MLTIKLIIESLSTFIFLNNASVFRYTFSSFLNHVAIAFYLHCVYVVDDVLNLEIYDIITYCIWCICNDVSTLLHLVWAYLYVMQFISIAYLFLYVDLTAYCLGIFACIFVWLPSLLEGFFFMRVHYHLLGNPTFLLSSRPFFMLLRNWKKFLVNPTQYLFSAC